MSTPSQLREEAHAARRLAEQETTRPLKRMLADHALALVQLAEKIEREETGFDQFLTSQPSER